MQMVIYMVILTFQIRQSLMTMTPEATMRDILDNVMRCPSENLVDADSNAKTPVAAFSPARYIQMMAMARVDSRVQNCGESSSIPFGVNDPRTWNFCAMGDCIEEQCSCFAKFSGDKCHRFSGSCWLAYCFLNGCASSGTPALDCRCDPGLFGETVSGGIYFYDFGKERVFRYPPEDFETDIFNFPSVQKVTEYKVVPSASKTVKSSAKSQQTEERKGIYVRNNRNLNNGQQNPNKIFNSITPDALRNKMKIPPMRSDYRTVFERFYNNNRKSGYIPEAQTSKENSQVENLQNFNEHFRSQDSNDFDEKVLEDNLNEEKSPSFHYDIKNQDRSLQRKQNDDIEKFFQELEEKHLKHPIKSLDYFSDQNNLPSLHPKYGEIENLKRNQRDSLQRFQVNNKRDFRRKGSDTNLNFPIIPSSNVKYQIPETFQRNLPLKTFQTYKEQRFRQKPNRQAPEQYFNQAYNPPLNSNYRNQENIRPHHQTDFVNREPFKLAHHIGFGNQENLLPHSSFGNQGMLPEVQQMSYDNRRNSPHALYGNRYSFQPPQQNQENVPPPSSNYGYQPIQSERFENRDNLHEPHFEGLNRQSSLDAQQRKQPNQEFYENRVDNLKRPQEFSTKKYLWSDTEEDDGEEEFKYVSGIRTESSMFRNFTIFLGLLFVIFNIL